MLNVGTTLLDSAKAWMLAHDWTEIGEGPAGWMWQHATGRKVAVFRDLSDRDAWEGLIGRLAVAHASHSGDIEREIRGGDEPALLSDEQLRRITQYVHPDEGTAYVRPWLHSMAAELLTARDESSQYCSRIDALYIEGTDLRAHVAELEAADREHSQLIEYLHHAHGIDIDREDDDFREWQQQYGEVSDRD
ncbi:hypothetical protein ACWFRF_20740 [Nocardia sp. NPDC055165]